MQILNISLKKPNNQKNNPEKSSTTKISEDFPCKYSMSTVWAFDNIENKHSLYHGKGCMKKFGICLREHAADVIKFKRRKCFH